MFDVKNLTELISVDIFLETSNNLNVCGSLKYFEQLSTFYIKSSNKLPAGKNRRVIESPSNGDIALRIIVISMLSLVLYGPTSSNSSSNNSQSMRWIFLKTFGSLTRNSFNRWVWPCPSRLRGHHVSKKEKK